MRPNAAHVLVSGANGFPGFLDSTARTWSRGSTALYGDVELRDSGGWWTVDDALRFEHFQVFGNTGQGKLSAPHGLTGAMSVRGGVNSGLHASTPAQRNTLNVQTTIDPTTLRLVDRANVPSSFRATEPKGETVRLTSQAKSEDVLQVARHAHPPRYEPEFAGCHYLPKLDTIEIMGRITGSMTSRRLAYAAPTAYDMGAPSGCASVSGDLHCPTDVSIVLRPIGPITYDRHSWFKKRTTR